MMRFWAGVLVVVSMFCAGKSEAQSVQSDLSPKTSWTGFAAYANASSHILLGGGEDQRLLLMGGSWNRREFQTRWMALRYQVEVIPVAVLVSPYSNLTQVVTYVPGATPLPGLPAGTYSNSGVYPSKCFAENYSGPLYSPTITGKDPPIGTISVMQQCSTTATFGGGLSPLGQRANFLPRQMLQPFILSNAGFLAFTRNIPTDYATRFNFTFEFGAGLELHPSKGHAWALDARYHHTSNAFRGIQNPGIDNVIFRLSYSAPFKKH